MAKKTTTDGLRIDVGDLIEKAFQRALERAVESRVRKRLKRALRNGSPLSKKIEDQLDLAARQFFADGAKRSKSKTGKT